MIKVPNWMRNVDVKEVDFTIDEEGWRHPQQDSSLITDHEKNRCTIISAIRELLDFEEWTILSLRFGLN